MTNLSLDIENFVRRKAPNGVKDFVIGKLVKFDLAPFDVFQALQRIKTEKFREIAAEMISGVDRNRFRARNLAQFEEVLLQIMGSANMKPNLESAQGGAPRGACTGEDKNRACVFLSVLAISDSHKGKENRDYVQEADIRAEKGVGWNHQGVKKEEDIARPSNYIPRRQFLENMGGNAG